jgi:hypothetical protein
MFEIPFGGLYQIGNQVIPALQLHINLRKGVFEEIPERDEPVVDTDNPHDNDGDNGQRNQ